MDSIVILGILGPGWAKLGQVDARLGEVGPKLGQVGAKLGQVGKDGRTWEQEGPVGPILGLSSKKNLKSLLEADVGIILQNTTTRPNTGGGLLTKLF